MLILWGFQEIGEKQKRLTFLMKSEPLIVRILLQEGYLSKVL